MRANAAHVIRHQTITPLGHHVHLFVRPFRCSAQTDKANANTICNILNFAQVHIHFVTCFMNGFQGRTRQFQLTTRFQRYIRAIFFQPNDIALFQYGRPIVCIAQPFQHGFDGTLALVGEWFQRVFAITELFMLGANAPICFWFTSVFQILRQLRHIFNWAAATLGNRHELNPLLC